MKSRLFLSIFYVTEDASVLSIEPVRLIDLKSSRNFAPHLDRKVDSEVLLRVFPEEVELVSWVGISGNSPCFTVLTVLKSLDESLVIEQLLLKVTCSSLVHDDIVGYTEAIVDSFVVETLYDMFFKVIVKYAQVEAHCLGNTVDSRHEDLVGLKMGLFYIRDRSLEEVKQPGLIWLIIDILDVLFFCHEQSSAHVLINLVEVDSWLSEGLVILHHRLALFRFFHFFSDSSIACFPFSHVHIELEFSLVG